MIGVSGGLFNAGARRVPGNDGDSMITEQHEAYLEAHACPKDFCEAAGVRSVSAPPEGLEWSAEGGGLLFPYANGELFRPDAPKTGAKYVSPEGVAVGLASYGSEAPGVLIVEGTKQALAVAAAVSSEFLVLGMSGCYGWKSRLGVDEGLSVVEGRRVYVFLDADAETNRDVFDAGMSLARVCRGFGASEVLFPRLEASGKTGVDDILAASSGAPALSVMRWIGSADSYGRKVSKPADRRPAPPPFEPKAPPTRRKDEVAALGVPGFSDGGGFNPEEFFDTVIGDENLRATREGLPAFYRDGVYSYGPNVICGKVVTELGRLFKTSHLSVMEAYTKGMLAEAGRELPDLAPSRHVNVLNGMLNLDTLVLEPHDPKFQSSTQLPVRWDPEASCPKYEAWAAEIVGGQLGALEETAAQVLDPSVSPTRGAILFGPPSSGKSTFLALIRALVGVEHTSSLSLHQLSSDTFAAANLYGKALNVYSELPAKHLQDLSAFKILTGEEVISANRKYGAQFSFYSRALFLFSCNTVPSVPEATKAYFKRLTPFEFDKSYLGAEDSRIREDMLSELPGILARLVRAFRARERRGRWLPATESARATFERRSMRAQNFVEECCAVVDVGDRRAVSAEEGTTKTRLYEAYKSWSEGAGYRAMGRDTFVGQVMTVPGVFDVRSQGDRRRCLNVVVKGFEDWDSDPEEVVEVLPSPVSHARVRALLAGISSVAPAEPSGLSVAALPAFPERAAPVELSESALPAFPERAAPPSWVGRSLSEPLPPGVLDGGLWGFVSEFSSEGSLPPCDVHGSDSVVLEATGCMSVCSVCTPGLGVFEGDDGEGGYDDGDGV